MGTEMTTLVNDALVKAGIEIPLPQRVLHMKGSDEKQGQSSKSKE